MSVQQHEHQLRACLVRTLLCSDSGAWCALLVTQLYLTVSGYNQPGSSVHGILQARTLEWVAISDSRASSQLGIKSTSLASPALAGGFFTTSATWEGWSIWSQPPSPGCPPSWMHPHLQHKYCGFFGQTRDLVSSKKQILMGTQAATLQRLSFILNIFQKRSPQCHLPQTLKISWNPFPPRKISSFTIWLYLPAVECTFQEKGQLQKQVTCPFTTHLRLRAER